MFSGAGRQNGNSGLIICESLMDPRSKHTGKQDTIQVSVGGCAFVGSVYEISSGNCSLYLSRRQSDFSRLPLDSITWLRRSADFLGEIYVGSG